MDSLVTVRYNWMINFPNKLTAACFITGTPYQLVLLTFLPIEDKIRILFGGSHQITLFWRHTWFIFNFSRLYTKYLTFWWGYQSRLRRHFTKPRKDDAIPWLGNIRKKDKLPDGRREGTRPRRPSSFPGRRYGSWDPEHPWTTIMLQITKLRGEGKVQS